MIVQKLITFVNYGFIQKQETVKSRNELGLILVFDKLSIDLTFDLCPSVIVYEAVMICIQCQIHLTTKSLQRFIYIYIVVVCDHSIVPRVAHCCVPYRYDLSPSNTSNESLNIVSEYCYIRITRHLLTTRLFADRFRKNLWPPIKA